MHLSPAAYVLMIFNGVRATARVAGRSPSSVCKWNKPKEQRGTNGLIPTKAQPILLDKARDLGLDLTAEDLIFGREVNE